MKSGLKEVLRKIDNLGNTSVVKENITWVLALIHDTNSTAEDIENASEELNKSMLILMEDFNHIQKSILEYMIKL